MCKSSESKYNSNSKNCLWCFAVLTGISGLVLMVVGIGYLKSLSHDEIECGVVNVTYPQSLHDSSNLIKCDCGKYCYVHSGTCIRIYGYAKHNPNKIVMFQNNVKNNAIQTCTFSETKCKNGEHIQDRINAIERAQNTANEYIKYIESKESIKCYQMSENSDTIFLNNDDLFITFIVTFSIFLSILFCCLISICCNCCNKEKTVKTFEI